MAVHHGGRGPGHLSRWTKAAVSYRTVDTAGPELVVNGDFPTDISGWTNASSAGGAIAWNSGRLRATNTSGTARARQAVSVTAGQRYACFVWNPAGTVAASIAVGSTTPGSSDYLNIATNASIAYRVGSAEITAATATVQFSLNAAIAGNVDFDNVSLRRLIPTDFAVGKVFTDDFSVKADGPLGVTPDGLLWRHMTAQNGTQVYPYISSGKMQADASGDGSGNTGAYPYLDLGTGKVAAIHCDIHWSAAAGVAMISMEPTGTLPTITNIVTNSVHIVFTASQVDIRTYVGGVSELEVVAYAAPVQTDGRKYAGVGWSLAGDTMTLTLPDGSTIQRTNSKFSQVQGSVAIPEIFYNTSNPGPVAISKVSVALA